jgi:PAS domain S-box-containing protein
MGEGLIATDNEGTLLLINSVACNLLGVTESRAVGNQAKGHLKNEELENWIEEVLQRKSFTKRYLHRELDFDKKEEKIVSVTLAPIKEKDKEISGLVLVLMDISEERKLERMKAEFQKLVAVVAHELKAPINAIEGYLDIIIKGYMSKNPEKALTYLERSRDKAETLRNLIQDLLSLTSIESGKLTREMEQVEVQQIISESLIFLENEAKVKNLSIVRRIPEILPQIFGDKKALGFLFTNLISNAIKYNKENGSIDITAKKEGNKLVVSIRDTGIGISESDLGRIFEEFYRSKSEAVQKISGTGLGLSIAKSIAELHDGSIKASSTLGDGSNFEVVLPISS